MAAAMLSVKVTGLERANRTVARFKRALRDLRPLFAALESDFYQVQEQHFDLQGRGAQWQPNSPVYAAIKAREYGERRVMHLEGTLRESLTRRGGPSQVRKVSDRNMTLGTSLRYAATHDRGSSKDMWIPRPFFLKIRGVPARPLIGWGQRLSEDERAWTEIGERHFRATWEGEKT